MNYPITEEHKRVAVENMTRLVPDLTIRLYDGGGWGWQISARKPDTGKEQDFDAYLVGELFMKKPALADQSMLAEIRWYVGV